GQLQRYYREMTREGYTTIHLVYLTLHGETPGAESAGHLDELVLSISYQDDLMPWLDACIQAAGAYPAVHEVLKQYQHVVAGLTGQAQGRKMIDVKALIADEEHLAAAISIGQALEQLKIDLLFRFWIRLEERLLAEGFEILDYWKYSRKRVERYYQKHPHRHGILVALPELLGNESLGFFVGVYKRLYYGFIALENGAPAALAHEPRFALLTRLLKQLDPRWQVGSETLGWRRPERDLDFVNFSTPHTLALIDPAQIGAYMEGLIDEIQYTIAKFYAACETELPAQLMDGAL
ncbi:MAG: PD-(D/E)XK nuclease family protein, partial [Anaerolineae bacterium]|nr:PD-(D/E)XK nuclease family protein [Anaerolineae bacterium]